MVKSREAANIYSLQDGEVSRVLQTVSVVPPFLLAPSVSPMPLP